MKCHHCEYDSRPEDSLTDIGFQEGEHGPMFNLDKPLTRDCKPYYTFVGNRSTIETVYMYGCPVCRKTFIGD